MANSGHGQAGVFHRSQMDPGQKHQSPNLTYMRGRLCGCDGGREGGGVSGVGAWGGLMGSLHTKVHTWVCLVPDDLEWNEPFNDD